MICAVFDIETSALEAVGAGFLLCAVIKPLSLPGNPPTKPIVFRYDKLGCKAGKDKPIVDDVMDELSKYDLLIGHNVLKFDLPYIKSRAAQHGCKFALEPFVYDTKDAFKRTGYRTVDNGFGKPTASLAHVIDFFDIRLTKEYPLYPRQHWKSIWEDGKNRTKAMDMLTQHCVADVLANEQVYWKLMAVDRIWGLRRYK